MSGFLADSNYTKVTATTTASNVAVFTSGPASFNVTNTSANAVVIGFTQDTAANIAGNVVIPGGWPMMVQAQNPERTPGTIYAYVQAISGTADVYITSGFEV